MVSYPRFTPTERRKLTMSARARESFRAVGIRGGAGPGEGAPQPSQGYYELSEDDRALIETVIADTHSDDNVKRVAALTWWSNAINQFPNVGPLAVADWFAGKNVSSFILDLFGMWLMQPFEIPSGGCGADAGGTQAVLSGLSVSSLYEINDNTFVDVTIGAIFHIHDWICDVVQPAGPYPTEYTRYRNGQMRVQVVPPAGALPTPLDRGHARVFGGGDFDRAGDWHDSCEWPGYDVVDAGGHSVWPPSGGMTQTYSANSTSCFSADITPSTGSPTACPQITVCVGEDFNWGPEIGAPEMTGAPPVGEPTVPVDPCDLVDALKDYPYAPPPGTPPGTPPGGLPPDGNPVDPGTGLPPGELPEQPPDPGVNPPPGQPPTGVPPGTGDPGLPPGDPGLPVPDVVPPGPVVPGVDPIDSGIEDPAAGGCMKLAGEPAGFRDPTQAGGIARKYQPGQPMVIDYGEGSRCKTKIVKVKPDPAVPEICVAGGIDNSGKVTEKTCYGPGPVEDAIRSVLGDMVAEGGNIIFDSDCTRELHRPLCFRAGTLKRVILNKLLDLCGFCVFPMFDCNVIVGYCGPVGVIWTYHEDVDLTKFDLEYDGQEVFDYVEVFRGDFMTQSGGVAIRGNSVLYPVGSPASSVTGDRVYQYEVPYGTPDSELNSIAITLAAKLRTQALPEIAFGVPLNSLLRLRHQLRIQMPSVGFDAYYMVTQLVRDYDRENGHLSTGLARWLHAA